MNVFKVVGEWVINGVQKAQRDISNVTEQAEQSDSRMSGAFKRIGAAVATYFATDKIISFGRECIEVSAQVRAQTAQFEAAFGDLQGTASKMFESMGNDLGILSTRLQTVGTGAFSQFKGAGLDAAEALKKTDQYTRLAADGAAYYDMSLEEVDTLMRSFIRGNTEAGDRLGLFTSESQRNAAAMEKLGKKYIECTEAEKQMIMLDIAQSIYDASGATGQAAREAEGYENVLGNLRESIRQLKAKIGEPLLDAITPVLQTITEKFTALVENVDWDAFKEKVTAITDKLTTGFMWLIENGEIIMSVITGIVTALLTFKGLMFISTILTSFQTFFALLQMGVPILTAFRTAFGLLNVTMTANPVFIIVAAIAGLVAAFVVLWNKCEGFREFWIGLWEKIKAAFNVAVNWVKAGIDKLKAFFQGLWSAITTVFNAIKNTIMTVWNGIKTGISTVVNGIKSVITTVFNAVKNTISKIFNGIKSVATTVWNGIKTAITKPIEAAKNVVKSIVDKIKGFFKFKISLPKIKLPHFSIKPSGWKLSDLLKGSIPRLGIDWYAKGGILERPTVFGINPNTGNAMVGGEAGKEAVAPISELMKYVRVAVAESNGGMAAKLDRLYDLLSRYLPILGNTKVVLDSGAMVGEMINDIDRELGTLSKRKGRGW